MDESYILPTEFKDLKNFLNYGSNSLMRIFNDAFL